MGTTCEGMTHEPQLVPSSGWRSVGSGAQSPQFEPPSTELPPSPCSAFGSGSFLPAPAPTLAHFHTASHVAWLLTKLNFNYFFFFFFKPSRAAAFSWQQLPVLLQQGQERGGCLVGTRHRKRRTRGWDGQAEGHRSRLLAESLTRRRGLLAFSFHPSSAPQCPALGNATRDPSHHTCVSCAGWEHLGPLFCR